MHPDLVNALHEFVGLFEKRGYQHAIMGGIAVRILGIPRPTYDMVFTRSISPDLLFMQGELDRAYMRHQAQKLGASQSLDEALKKFDESAGA